MDVCMSNASSVCFVMCICTMYECRYVRSLRTWSTSWKTTNATYEVDYLKSPRQLKGGKEKQKQREGQGGKKEAGAKAK